MLLKYQLKLTLLGLLILFLMGAIFIHNGLTNGEANDYDINDSKKIESGESILLAVALSADSISVGMAVGALQMSWLYTTLEEQHSFPDQLGHFPT